MTYIPYLNCYNSAVLCIILVKFSIRVHCGSAEWRRPCTDWNPSTMKCNLVLVPNFVI